MVKFMLAVGLCLGSGVAQAGLCSPGQINPAVQRSISPGAPLPAVIGVMGCPPSQLVPVTFPPSELGTVLACWVSILGEMAGGALCVVFDKTGGASFTQYFSPVSPVGGITYSGQFRGLPPETPPWIPTAGTIVPVQR